jgi:hypothetical protein
MNNLGLKFGVLNREVSSWQRCPLREIPLYFPMIPKGLLDACITGNPHTNSAFDKPVELHWWTCGDKVIRYDQDPGFFDPGLNVHSTTDLGILWSWAECPLDHAMDLGILWSWAECPLDHGSRDSLILGWMSTRPRISGFFDPGLNVHSTTPRISGFFDPELNVDHGSLYGKLMLLILDGCFWKCPCKAPGDQVQKKPETALVNLVAGAK